MKHRKLELSQIIIMEIFKFILFLITAIFTLGATFYFGSIGQYQAIWGVLGAGFLIMAFSNIDKLSRFKGAGFEAEMRQKIEDAYATLENLQDLAVTLVESLIILLALQ